MCTDSTFASITDDDLTRIAGGKSNGDEQITALLTNITSSIKDLAGKSSQSSGMDPTMLMVMMMAMNSGGGGVVPAPAAAVAAPPPIINVSTSVRGGGGGCRPRKCW